MTTDLLTFFHPGGSAGRDSTFSVQTGDSAIEIWVFDRSGELDLSRFAAASAANDEEFKKLVSEIQGLLQPRGGIFFYAWNHNDVVRTRMYRTEAPGYALSRRMLRLSPSGDARFEDITGSADLAMGDHLIVPVSAEAEERLQSFCKELKGFPSDLETSILNIIRRPSLEWRIERIERTLSLPPATRTGQHRVKGATFLDKVHHAVMWQIPIGPAIAAALILTAGSLAAYGKLFTGPAAASQEMNKKDETTEKKKEEKPSEPESRETSSNEVEEEGTALTELADSEKGFSDALRGSENSAIKKLYQTHFKDQPESFWGIAKLQALQLDLMREDDPLLGDATVSGAGKMRDLYQKSKETLKRYQPALTLLAWSHCRQGGNGPFPKTSSELRDSLPLKTDLPCEDLNPEDAQAGLDALTEWVKDRD
jgi:hypothetical protein